MYYQDQNRTCPTYDASSVLRVDLNPQSYLYNPRKEGPHSKYRAIIDYIPKSARTTGDDEEEFELLPNVRLTTGRRSKLDSVTPAQWTAANACILADLVEQSPGDTKQLTLDYMSHTTKVGVLATHYSWRSAIRWDDEYREKQHLHQFRWGSDSAHMCLVQLVPRDKEPERNKRQQKPSTPAPVQTTRSIPPCFNWNKEIPCGQTPCNFKHECEWCKSPSHPKVRHDEALRQQGHHVQA